jgi:Flp pilus assembly secretin CpaC
LLFAPVILVTALLVVWPGWLRTAQAQSWVSEEGDGVRHIVVTLNKSRTLRFDKPFASAVVGAPDIVDALPMSDRALYIQGKKVGTTNVSVFDQSMKLIGVLDVEVAIDTGNLQQCAGPPGSNRQTEHRVLARPLSRSIAQASDADAPR